MDIRKPKKILVKEKRKELQKIILELMDMGFTGNEIAINIDGSQPSISSLAKHGEHYSISLEKCDELLEKITPFLNSLKQL